MVVWWIQTGAPVRAEASNAAESACMAAVNRQYGGNYDVRVISSEYSEANSLVMVAGGPNRERWAERMKHGEGRHGHKPPWAF